MVPPHAWLRSIERLWLIKAITRLPRTFQPAGADYHLSAFAAEIIRVENTQLVRMKCVAVPQKSPDTFSAFMRHLVPRPGPFWNRRAVEGTVCGAAAAETAPYLHSELRIFHLIPPRIPVSALLLQLPVS
jgi:hypothetical protein